MLGPRPSPLPHALATVLFACAISPAVAQLALGEATLFRFALNEDLGMGSALAAGDFDGSGRADLAIGVPNENVGVFADAGFVHVLYGTFTGLLTVGSQGFSENELPASAAADNSEFFGLALATIDLAGDGVTDLVAAAPNDHFNGFAVGLVAVVPGRPLFADGFEIGDTSAWPLTVP